LLLLATIRRVELLVQCGDAVAKLSRLGGERRGFDLFQQSMTAVLLDRLTHRYTIFEMNGERYRSRESVKSAKPAKQKKTQEACHGGGIDLPSSVQTAI